jgi:hypothetical protein
MSEDATKRGRRMSGFPTSEIRVWQIDVGGAAARMLLPLELPEVPRHTLPRRHPGTSISAISLP